MLNNDEYEVLKSSFIDSQRLFDKLNKVADTACNLDYDESGLYIEEEETCNRHWLKLSTKILNSLSESLKDFNVKLLKNDGLLSKELTFELLKANEKSIIVVDYSENGAISISQMS